MHLKLFQSPKCILWVPESILPLHQQFRLAGPCAARHYVPLDKSRYNSLEFLADSFVVRALAGPDSSNHTSAAALFAVAAAPHFFLLLTVDSFPALLSTVSLSLDT